jgi:hypothetical protein
MAVTAPLATLVNPYGWYLWTFLTDTVGLSRSDIADWQPLWKVPWGMLIPWVTAGTLAVLSTRSHLRISPAYALIVVFCGVGSLWVSRLDAFFVLAVVMLLGPHINASYQRIRPRQHTISESSRPTPRLRMAMLASTAIAAGILAGRGNFQCIDMGRGWSPPESGLVQLIKDRGVQGRILIYFDWVSTPSGTQHRDTSLDRWAS